MLTDDQRIEARHKLAAGRVLAYRKMPYYTRALIAIETFEREGMGTFGVDKFWRLYYDPVKCLEWTTEEISAVWLHEVNHLIRDHNKRFEALEGVGHDQEMFNAAADAAINTDLKKQGVILPNPEVRVYVESKLSPSWKKGMTAEQMYWAVYGKGKGKKQEEAGKGTPEPPQSSDEKDEEEGEDPFAGLPDARDTSEESESDSQDDAEGENEEESSEDPEGSQNGSDDSNEDSDGDSESSEKGSEEGGESPQSDSSDESGEESSEDSEGPQNDSDGSEESEEDSENSESGGEGSDAEDSEGSSEDSESGEEGQEGSESGEEGEQADGEQNEPATKPQPESDCGSCAGGESREYEDKTGDRAMERSSADFLRKKVSEDIVDYDRSNPGVIPGDVVRDAKHVLEPQVDWRDEFIALCRRLIGNQRGYQDYTYARPSRRTGTTNVILPSMKSPNPPQIAAVLDTSGSMREGHEIAAALGELEDLVNRFGRLSPQGGVHIVNCDVGATVELVRDLRNFEIVGGGGTDMRVGIKCAAEIKPRMNIIITITDGMTPWPDKKPQENLTAHYIALITQDNRRGWGTSNIAKNVPEWMHCIEVKISDRRRPR